MASPPLHITFVTSAKKFSDLPPSPAEVAVVGRSNVGKSSLINAVANHRQLAKVSSTPGRTQLINLFALPSGSTFVDLPGYGFAAVGSNKRNQWQSMIEGYLVQRQNLRMIFVLVDGEIGPTKLDIQMLEWLRYEQLNHSIVATKMDKVKPSKVGARKKELAELCTLEIDDILWVSAAKGTGIDAFRSRLKDLLDQR